MGRYTVVELPTEDNYWLTELGFHDVTVKAGETTVDNWLNKEQGLAWFYKKTNTGESVEGWHITVYSDEACTQKVGTLITNEDGRAGYYLDPGTYWAKETGDEHGRFEDEYWMVDETIHKFEIKPHEDVSITFTNVQYGRLKITKTVEGGGSVEGWQFKITDAEGTVLDGSPFATDEDGIILTGNLLPGKYTVEEILPENSFYQCVNENPQTVIVKQGEIAGVSFTNALRSGKITVEKIDTTGEHLAGATFLLEWSAEGSLWYRVKYLEGLAKVADIVQFTERGLFRCGEKGVEYAKDLCPVDTGNTRNSITHTVEDGKKAIVGTPIEHAIYQEMGTGKYAEGGGGRPTPWCYQDTQGIWHWTAGNRAHPFIKPSIADHQGTYKNILKDELSKGD